MKLTQMKYWAVRLIRVPVALVLLFVTLAAGQRVPSSEVDDEEYLVFSAALQHLLDGPDQIELGSTLLVVDGKTRTTIVAEGLRARIGRIPQAPQKQPNGETVPEQQADPTKPERLELWRRLEEQKRATPRDAEAFRSEALDETIADWTEKNTESYPLADKFRLKVRVVVPTEADWKNLRQADNGNLHGFYQAFHMKYPGARAITSVSRVGFNKDRTQAIVLVGYNTGPEGGEGDYMLLAKENGVWQVRHVIAAWLS